MYIFLYRCIVDDFFISFPKTQHNLETRGLALLSKGKCWLPAYKGDSYQAVNLWPTSAYRTSLTNHAKLRETDPAY